MKPKAVKISESELQAIADNLRILFKKHKMTDNEVATALDIPAMTIRRLVLGETTDPRISTLKLIADYFRITVDTLVSNNHQAILEFSGQNKPHFVPLLDWATAEKIKTIKEIDLSTWQAWHPISVGQNYTMGDNAFALESRPSMYPRFPQGTIFIIDPDTDPSDGDIVLVRINKNNELTLRELIIDPPEWQLHPIVPGSSILHYPDNQYKIAGVVLFTLLYNRKTYS